MLTYCFRRPTRDEEFTGVHLPLKRTRIVVVSARSSAIQRITPISSSPIRVIPKKARSGHTSTRIIGFAGRVSVVITGSLCFALFVVAFEHVHSCTYRCEPLHAVTRTR